MPPGRSSTPAVPRAESKRYCRPNSKTEQNPLHTPSMVSSSHPSQLVVITIVYNYLVMSYHYMQPALIAVKRFYLSYFLLKYTQHLTIHHVEEPKF